MISNFEDMKKQLSELSEVINKFKSEAVQLRLIEIVLGDGTELKQGGEKPVETADTSSQKPRPKLARSKSKTKSMPKATPAPAPKAKPSPKPTAQAKVEPKPKTQPKAKAKTADENPSTKLKASSQGATSALNDLLNGNFFEQPKSINDIVSHCEEKLGRSFKANAFSGKLSRLSRDGVLDRSKNDDGRYEYVKAKTERRRLSIKTG